MRHKRELPLVFPKGAPIRMTPEAEALARKRNHSGKDKIFTGVVGRKLTMQNIWTGQIPVKLTGSRYSRLMLAERWEPDPNPPAPKAPPPVRNRKTKEVPFVATAQPKVKKPRRLEDLVFWEAEPASNGIMTLNSTLEHLTCAVESMPKDHLSDGERELLVQAVSSAKLYLEPGTI